jgi:uncharacterized alpha-E superfamily protein
MLSRTAENLYWTGRYVERAENTARTLDVSLRAALQHGLGSEAVDDWDSVLDMFGERERFEAKYGSPSAEAITAFVVLDEENPSSVRSCFWTARENMRALRATISMEMWETVNSSWLAARDFDRSTLRVRGAREICEWVVGRSQLFLGVSHGTTIHDDAFHFIRLGTFLERADNTARFLDAKYVRQTSAPVGPAAAYYAWGVVLRALGAIRAYRQAFRDVIDADKVAELLLLQRNMPRSLRFCAQEVLGNLDYLGKNRDLECQRLAGELHARLRFARMDRILESGVHEFLNEIVEDLVALGSQISKDFLMTV